METDIDMSGREFHPVGGSYLTGQVTGTFSGIFDGNHKKILDLTVDEGTYFSVGLFSKNSGTIKNLTLENVEVYGLMEIGGIAGENIGVINNTHSTNIVIYSYQNIGGIDGFNSNILENTSSSGSIEASRYVGGLVGYNTGIISNSNSLLNGSSLFIGGLVGDNEFGEIYDCFSTGSVIGIAARVGGLVGRNRLGVINNSFSKGDIYWWICRN